MKLIVVRYNENGDFHDCIDEKGNLRRVDIMVDGKLEDKDRLAYIGKVVNCDFLSAYIEIANGVSLYEGST